MTSATKDRDLRDWIELLDKQGELKRITAEVDWREELGAINRINTHKNGPALLFENIKDYKDTRCTKLFTNGLGATKRLAMALNLPLDSGDRTIVEVMKKRYAQRLDPILRDTGPVKENILTGKDIDLYQIPVPLVNYRDGGRYINPACSVVTRDPDTGMMNIGTYRGMLSQKHTIP
ncbi:MAG: UbiD family decarboxylase, partial [Desulfobacterales bacterium]|nr:UbiD family decarboxylase [Desulfobacterales bacterium]